MAPHKRSNPLHQTKQNKNDTTTTLQPRTQPHRTILEKHQTTPRNKNILQQTTTHNRIRKSTKKKYFYPRNMPLLMLNTISVCAQVELLFQVRQHLISLPLLQELSHKYFYDRLS